MWFTYVATIIGAIVAYLGYRLNEKDPKRWWLLMAGISALLITPFVVLHNLTYTLAMQYFGRDVWTKLGTNDEPVFFVLALIICPALFVIGLIGATISHFKSRRQLS